MQVDEPEEGANINVGLMKNLTGGDKIQARGLFKEPVEFKPQFKIILVCNDMPEVPPYDGGVWRRMEAAEFPSRFVDDPKEEFEFKKDNNLKDKLENWKETFMSILLHYFKIYKEEGLTAPDEVTKFTKEFQEECDLNADFMTQRLIQVNDLSAGLKPGEVFREFKVWQSENNANGKIKTQKDLMNYLEKKYGKKMITHEVIKGFIWSKQSNNYNEEDAYRFSVIPKPSAEQEDSDNDESEFFGDQNEVVEVNASNTEFGDL